jgi:hypothetical protein
MPRKVTKDRSVYVSNHEFGGFKTFLSRLARNVFPLETHFAFSSNRLCAEEGELYHIGLVQWRRIEATVRVSANLKFAAQVVDKIFVQ